MTLMVDGQFRPMTPPVDGSKRRGAFRIGGLMNAVKIGILYSTTGPYGAMGRESRDGAEFAIEELSAAHGDLIQPIFIDPHGNIPEYLEGARSMLRDSGCRHIVGTITSLARKEEIGRAHV